jgi:hypothetical protein
MKSFKEFKASLEEKCWTGYKRVPGTKAYSKGSCVKEDGGAAGGAGGAAGVASAGPTNVVGGGAIAGTGGKGGEPGVYLKKKKAHNPVMMGMGKRKDF